MKDYFNFIDDEELLHIFSNAVKIPSTNPTGNEKPMCEYVQNLLSNNGINYTTVEVDNDRYNIIARIKGQTDKDAIIFTGHMDVVPVSEDELSRWEYPPYSATIKDGYLYGRGSSDMKSGLMSAIYAMIMLKRHNITPKQDIILVATVDEENLMKGSSALINSSLIDDAKYLVVCEPTNLKVCNAQKGRTWADVYVKGKTAHGSQAGVGENAIYMAIKLIEKIRTTNFEDYPQSFWRTLAIKAGVEPQVVPDNCIFTVDARIQVGHPTNSVWEKLQELINSIKQTTPDFDATYKVIDERESWYTNEDEIIISLVKDALKEIECPYETDIFLGSTDASKLIKNALVPVIIGPGDLSVVHKENECIDLQQLYKSARLYLSIMINDKI